MISTRINPEANYGICDAALLACIDRSTLRRYVTQRPDLFPSIKDPISGRKLIAGTTILKIRDKKYN